MAGVKTCTPGNKKCSHVQPKSKGLKMLTGSEKQCGNTYCLLDSKVWMQMPTETGSGVIRAGQCPRGNKQALHGAGTAPGCVGTVPPQTCCGALTAGPLLSGTENGEVPILTLSPITHSYIFPFLSQGTDRQHLQMMQEWISCSKLQGENVAQPFPAAQTLWELGPLNISQRQHATSWELKQDGRAVSPCCRANHADQGRGKPGIHRQEKQELPRGSCRLGLPYVSDLLSSELDFVFLEELSAREQEKRRERYRKYGDQTWGKKNKKQTSWKKKKTNKQNNTDLDLSG